MTGFGWDLPPGVTEGMIPGNRPGDAEAERYADGLDDSDLHDFVLDSNLDCAGGVIYEHPDEEGTWVMEQPWDGEPALPGWPTATHSVRGEEHTWLVFRHEEEAVAYMVAFHDAEIIEQMTAEHMEEGPAEEY